MISNQCNNIEPFAEAVFKTEETLIPAVIQDNNTLKVLMLGYMNRESYKITLETGLVTFYSRSRQKLWTKGETSGNFLSIVSIDPDCDNDTLLIRVNPAGPTCHTGNVSCFKGDDSEGFIPKLSQVIKERHNSMPKGSYTTSLFNDGIEKICKKVGEEASEVIIEAVKDNKERLVYEIGDLIYHLLVLMEFSQVSISQIENELYSRHK